MNNRFFVFLTTVAMFLSACSAPATESPATPKVQDAQTADTAAAPLIWQSNDSPCQAAEFFPESISFGECGSTLSTVPAPDTNYVPRLSELTSRYVSFTAETRAGNITFRGLGGLVPNEAEQRAIAEWAKLTFEVAQAERAGASQGLAFAWHREGGVAGFCDDMVVYLTGLAMTSDCKGFKAQTYLLASQLEQLYGWVDGLGNIDYNDSNAPLADGMMTITLGLSGNGQGKADEETIRDIIAFAATLDSQLGYVAAAGPDVADAEKDLRDYLTALHTGDYILAAKLYGGDTSLLQTWNPDIANDLPALFERACAQNGLQCLSPRTVTYRGSEVDSHHFWVEFSNDDGTLFQQGPCCGETGGTPVSMFPFSAEKSSSRSGYVAQELPPYVP